MIGLGQTDAQNETSVRSKATYGNLFPFSDGAEFGKVLLDKL
jgi:hypothetical protein